LLPAAVWVLASAWRSRSVSHTVSRAAADAVGGDNSNTHAQAGEVAGWDQWGSVNTLAGHSTRRCVLSSAPAAMPSGALQGVYTMRLSMLRAVGRRAERAGGHPPSSPTRAPHRSTLRSFMVYAVREVLGGIVEGQAGQQC
jgi:hypothetical protein